MAFMKPLAKSLFITVEGGEGVGKSFFIKKLSEALNSQDFTHKLTREPGGTKIAEKLRNLFAESAACGEPLTIEAEFLMISAARAQHVEQLIRPSLNKATSILCDRFADSSFVYQGALGGLSSDFIARVTEKCTHSLEPDLTFLLDCPLELAVQRMNKRSSDENSKGAISHYDQKGTEFHKRVREAFLKLAKQNSERIVTLDSSVSVDKLVAKAISHIEKRL